MAAATGAASAEAPYYKDRPQMLMFDYYLIFIHFFGYSINSNDFSEPSVKKDSRWRFVKFACQRVFRNRYISGKGPGTGTNDNDNNRNFEHTLSFANKVLTSSLIKDGQRKAQVDRKDKNLHNIDNVFASVHEKVRRDRAINNQNKGHRSLAGVSGRQGPRSDVVKQRQTSVGRLKYCLLEKLLIGLKFYAIILTTFLTANHCIVLVDYVMLSSKILTELLLELRLVITKFSALIFVLAWHSNRVQVRQLIQLVKSTSLRISCRSSLCPDREDTATDDPKRSDSLNSEADNLDESKARYYCKQVDKKVLYWWLMCVCVSVIHFSLSEAEIHTAHHLWTWLDDYSLHQLNNKTISKPTLYAMASFDNYIYTIHVYGTRLIGASIICIVCSLQTDSIKSLNHNATKLLQKIDPGDGDNGAVDIHDYNGLSDKERFFILGESNWIKVGEHARVAPSEGYLSVPLDRIAECTIQVVSGCWLTVSRLSAWLVSCGKHLKQCALRCFCCCLFNHNRQTPGFSFDTQRRRRKRQQSPLWHKYDAATAAISSAARGPRHQAAFRIARESVHRLPACRCCPWWRFASAPPTRWLLRRRQQQPRLRLMLQRQRRLKSSIAVVNGCRRCLREQQRPGNGGQDHLWATPNELVVGRATRLPWLKDDDSRARNENIVVRSQNGPNPMTLAAAAIERSNYDLWALGCRPRPTTFLRSSSGWDSGIDRLHRYLLLRDCFCSDNDSSPSFLFKQHANGTPEMRTNGKLQEQQRQGPLTRTSAMITAAGEGRNQHRTVITSELIEDNLGRLARDYELVRSSNQKIDSCFGHMLLIQFSFLFLMSCIDVVYFSIEFNPNTHKTKYIIVSGMILLWWPYFLLYKLASDIETASKELMITVRRLARLSLIASYNQINKCEGELDRGPGGDLCRCLNNDNDTTKATVMMIDDLSDAPAGAGKAMTSAAFEGDKTCDQPDEEGRIVSETSKSPFLERDPNWCDDRSSSANTAEHLQSEARVNEHADFRSAPFSDRGGHKTSTRLRSFVDCSLRMKRNSVWPSEQEQQGRSGVESTGNDGNNYIDGYHEASTLNLFSGLSQKRHTKAQRHIQCEPGNPSTVSSQHRHQDLPSHAHLLSSSAMRRRGQRFGSSRCCDNRDETLDELNYRKDAYSEHPANQSLDSGYSCNDYSSNHQILNQLDHLFVPIRLSIFGVMAVNKLFLLNFAKIVITSSVMIIQFISS